MSYTANGRRFRGTKRRVQRIRFSTNERWIAVLLTLLALLAVAAGGWLGAHYTD